MQVKQPSDTTGYYESKEEAKYPWTVLGLITGIYPTVLFVGLLLAMAFLGFRSAITVAATTEHTSEVSGVLHDTVAPEINNLKHGNR